MASFSLIPQRPFHGFEASGADIHLQELQANVASLSVPNGGTTALADAVFKEFGIHLPKAYMSTLAQDKTARFVWSTPDQYLIYGSENIVERSFNALSKVGYLTDQSHATVAVRLSGQGVWNLLERISTVDMHPEVFEIHNVTRISTEHVSITILRESEDGFILSSPSSSAGSFLHILTTTLDYLS